MTDEFAELADRLDEIAEDLTERAIDVLKTAVREGRTGRPAQERRLTQARRAIEKASHLLREDAAD